MPQIMVSSYQKNITISPRQRRLMGISSGLLLASLIVALFLNMYYFHIISFQFDDIIFLDLFLLLYFVAPIPLSLYISRQTGKITEGWKAGGMIGCTGVLFSTLGTIIYIVIIINTNPDLWYSNQVMIFIFLNAIGGVLISQLGCVVGSVLGNISKRFIH